VRVERRRELVSVESSDWDGDGEAWGDDSGTWDDPDQLQEGDGAGNWEGDWVGIGPATLRCEIVELSFGAGEQVIADKLRGVERCTVEVRASKFTRQITVDDRFRIPNTDRVLNIRHAPPPGRAGFIRFTCEAGVAT
jgi:hypothetical protein